MSKKDCEINADIYLHRAIHTNLKVVLNQYKSNFTLFMRIPSTKFKSLRPVAIIEKER